MAIPIQQYGYKQVVELESPEPHVLDRSRRLSLNLMKLELQTGVSFFRFSQVRNRISYCIL